MIPCMACLSLSTVLGNVVLRQGPTADGIWTDVKWRNEIIISVRLFSDDCGNSLLSLELPVQVLNIVLSI